MSTSSTPDIQAHEGPQPLKVVETENRAKVTWVIEKFSHLTDKKLYSPVFSVDGHNWRLLMYPKENDLYIFVYLNATCQQSLKYSLSKFEKCSISVINQLEYTCSIKKDTERRFAANRNEFGFVTFTHISELEDQAKGFLVNDKCIVEAELFEICKTKTRLKLLVDTKHNRVVLAESDKDFVDILLGFLTMPLGRIHKLLGKSASIGHISNIYDSVEHIDDLHFKTDACKSMLLNPLSEADQFCENLIVNINSSNQHNNLYICVDMDCNSKSTSYCSYFPNVKCSCAKNMSRRIDSVKSVSEDVFVKKGSKFVVTDDFRIMPASTSVLLSLLSKLGTTDHIFLEERIVDVGHKEVLNLLWDALSSKSPLTNLYFNCSANKAPKSSDTDDMYIRIPKTEPSEGNEGKKVAVKLLLTKNNDKVVHMEGDEEMANLMFSFLTLPLGFVIKSFNKSTPLGCVYNIYNSVEGLCLHGDNYIISEKCKMMLLAPKLGPFFSCDNQMFKIDEAESYEEQTDNGCYNCCFSKTACLHNIGAAELIALNPKSLDNNSEKGGGYAKGPCKFVVTNDLHVGPLSLVSTVEIVKNLEVSINDLVEKDIMIGESEALNLLKAALVSKTVLDDVFTLNYNKRRRI